MRKMKYVIGLLILFMVIGFATVSVSLSIDGNARVTSDVDDFKVYFSNAALNDERDLNLIKSETELVFDLLLDEVGTTYKITYDVTNASSVFDAQIAVSCTSGDNYLSVVNDFDTSTNLSALSTRTGNLTLKKLKSNANESDTTYRVTCSIVASPVERDSVATGEVMAPVTPLELAVGDVISIHGEKFNIISQTDDSVTMLAQYNLGTDYRQSTTINGIQFSTASSWEYTPGPKEIDVQTWATQPKVYINEYVSFLSEIFNDSDVYGDLITLAELGELGCTFPTDYSYSNAYNCLDSKYADWLINDQDWWTRSAQSDDSDRYVWFVLKNGNLSSTYHGSYFYGVRPTITIPIEYARMYAVKDYNIGDEVTIDTETFNVISETETTVTLLAQYNLGTDYRQSETANDTLRFADVGASGWEYTPGPKEVDIQTWSTNPKTYVNEYVSYLKNLTNDTTLSGDLITLQQLSNLGCSIREDYSSGSSSCDDSEYIDWIFNGQNWWTRSAVSDYETGIWVVFTSYSLYGPDDYDMERAGEAGIRPVITIDKSVL